MSVKQIVMAAAGLGGAAEATYIEDVFSTWLYTGNGSTQTITNGIDLAGEGGMVWFKARTSGGSSFTNHAIIDTVRGKNANGYYSIYPNLTDAQFSPTGSSDAVATAVSSSGFTVGGNVNVNYNTQTDASWTFRKAEKFFDVVTYTGNGVDPRAIPHSLGSVPGFIVVKRTNSGGSDWLVYHRSLATGKLLSLNATAAAYTTNEFTTTPPTSTVFYVANSDAINGAGYTYVAYLFAHDAGGFGDDGSENVISCGSYTGNGLDAGPIINLGWEPQYVIIKRTDSTGNWLLFDSMRGTPYSGGAPYILINSSDAEANNGFNYILPRATGFQIGINGSSSPASNASGGTYIYIAIRRPMKPPTVGTEVFKPSIGNNVSGSGLIANAGFPVDLHLESFCDGSLSTLSFDRLRGANQYVQTSSTAAETAGAGRSLDNMQGWFYTGTYNFSTAACIYDFKRASGFFDVVCYTGTGVARTVNHNLGVAPEMMLVKRRSAIDAWAVYFGDPTDYLRLNDPQAAVDEISRWNDTAPTSTVFTVGTDTEVNTSSITYVNYLFASCPGVSKVGSYTGTAATQQINCGFTGGARFVLIKRTDSTGDWYVWDSARGIVAGNDPYLLLNSTAAEVTSTDYVDTYSAGFEISSTAPAAINASGGTFIFLAIA
jgi:hypothetical protein